MLGGISLIATVVMVGLFKKEEYLLVLLVAPILVIFAKVFFGAGDEYYIVEHCESTVIDKHWNDPEPIAENNEDYMPKN